MSSTGYQILRSTDAGAPTLNGTAGSLLGVLDALLDIGGSDAFWQKVYTGTNKAAYRALNGERYYLRVDDSNAQYAAVRGFATMSDVDTGTDQFPTGTQQTNWSWFKSNTADSTARTYLGIATDRFFLLLINGGWSGSGQDLYFFGEPVKTNASDAGATVLEAYAATTFGGAGFLSGTQGTLSPYNSAGAGAPSNNSRNMLPTAKTPDNVTAAGLSVKPGASSNASVLLATYSDIPVLPFLFMSNVTSSDNKIRGRIPFIFFTPIASNDPNLAAGDTFTDGAGNTYQVASPGGTTSLTTQVRIAIMTSNTETGTP